ncbi:acetyl-CoA carboxylase biotin carboxylase subunit [Anaerocolumna sp. AGMB13025]|uniref:acetyl-CoA carboxylase biotin carboxylase subunit n=1 Tax=Anaerocolumna sp. AGMB13025 TaxID=3039116 RepID=UPI00241EE2D9|nr:acetyl-CoA carboxylase biotin carboxylase subunit [Anaerocolumna sp. AGMB13025]WFR58415.1 acetyl-CoA carboxylase biotin carboxylase subunit [Anaerocolumna sp. AGMB13025]
MIKKVLIANRGEIAVRIIRACREMGISTVAICSDIDKEALHAQLADETVCIGPMSSKDSYLRMDRILSATLATGADAIHPGFGFLSENSKFADLCRKCNITFIGPSAEVIDRMGNKSEARKTMMEAGVPVVPGTKEPVFTPEEGKRIADGMGYPVMIKASAGGGGKGMRIVNTEEEFIHLFETASQEAKNSFGDDTMYIEKYIKGARHIEFQILADNYGNVIHLGERDCSIQRRHQKMIEEAPSLVIDDKLRKLMGDTAVKAAKAARYCNAGTIEFILDQDNNFYFIEMNTRIQVEHGVTEMVTGIDLIREQIKIASGDKLSLTQEEVTITGHSIECRINAENPSKNFMPSPGLVTSLHMPGGNGVRIDSALYAGYKVPAAYDSLIVKLMVHDATRDLAIKKMRGVLGELVIEGIDTNIDFQYQIINHEDYIKGKTDTGFVERILSEKEA